jgi:hypothetical protein
VLFASAIAFSLTRRHSQIALNDSCSHRMNMLKGAMDSAKDAANTIIGVAKSKVSEMTGLEIFDPPQSKDECLQNIEFANLVIQAALADIQEDPEGLKSDENMRSAAAKAISASAALQEQAAGKNGKVSQEPSASHQRIAKTALKNASAEVQKVTKK